MKRKLFSVLVALALVVPVWIILDLTAPRATHAVQPIYGGIGSQRYVNPSEVIWWQHTAVPSVSNMQTFWHYAVQCTNNQKNTAFPNDPYFYDTGSVTFTPGSGTGFGKSFPCEGWLIYASFEINAPSTVPVGQDYAQILILNAMPAGGNILPVQSGRNIPGAVIKQSLVCVNANSFFEYSWPATGCRPPTEGPGLNQSLAVGNPAAGANFQQALSTLVRHRIINIRYTLVTSATAGNRFAGVNFLTGGVAGTVVGSGAAAYAQQASTTVVYNFMAGVGWPTNCSLQGTTQTAVQCTEVNIGIPNWWETTAAFETFAINSNVNGLLAGDQISTISIREVIWPETD